MKRTPMKRGGSLARKTRLRRFGARRKREASAEAKFRRAVLRRAKGRCERCGQSTENLEVHHIVTRARAPGWEGLHDPSNGAALCTWPGGGCHGLVHRHAANDWRKWLRHFH